MILVSSPARAQQLVESTEARVKKATVMVATFASERQRADTMLGSGTGYFINTTGLLVTNNHVIDPAHGRSLAERQKFQYETNRLVYKVVVESGTKSQRIFECGLVHQSMTADQALLQARTKKGELLSTPEYLELLPPWRLEAGMNVYAFGFPGGNRLSDSRESNAKISVSQGLVTAVPRAPSGRIRRIESNAIARPGNSGGPMVDADGLVVGTVTLMGQAKNQANMSALVPTNLTQAIVRRALALEMLAAESDLAPFLPYAAEPQEPLNLPGLTRLADRDMLVLRNGERIYGTVETEQFPWVSVMGSFDVPADAVAYILLGFSRNTLAFQGGDTLSSTEALPPIRLTTLDGKKIERSAADLRAVAMRIHETPTAQSLDDVTVLTSQSDRVQLESPEGQVKLAGLSGTQEAALDRIVRLRSEGGGDRRVVTLADGQQVTATVSDTPIKAVHRDTGKPLTIRLHSATTLKVELVDAGKLSDGGMTLSGVISKDIPEVYEIVRDIETGDLDSAREKLEPYLDRKRQVKMPDTMKWSVRLLDGVLALRSGKSDATRKIRKCFAATDPKIAAYARGCVAVLKAYRKGYDGKPLSDPAVFASAGDELGRQLLVDARAVLQDRKNLKGRRGEYNKYIMAIRRQEKRMEAASVFAGPDADDVLIELWSFAVDLCNREGDRLIAEHERIRAGRNRVSVDDFADLKEIERKYDKVTDVWKERFFKLRDYGFHYSDALDIRKLKQ